MNSVHIGGKQVGGSAPSYLIAEVGVNHNGRMDLAKELIDVAVEAGVDAVKFQTFRANRLVTPNAPKSNYQIVNTGRSESQFDMLSRLELTEGNFLELSDYCQHKGITFLTTPYNFEDLELLRRMDVAAIKIASAMIVEPVFIMEAAKLGRPLILATGMATLSEIAQTWEDVRLAYPEVKIVLLQCTTNYPANAKSANLRAMRMMQEAFGCIVGYSDHTVDSYTSVMALALGARVFERHLTLDRKMEGPDHLSSLNPDGLKEYVRVMREAEMALGDGIKRPCEEELPNIEKMRRSLVTAKSLKAGQIIQKNDLTLKRPATGISPRDFHVVVGSILRVDVQTDTILEWSMIENA